MGFFKECVKGIAIGAGAILPGISSGVLCVIFGIYEKLLDSILNFFKNPKQNIKFLLPIIIGVAIGVILFSQILNYLLYKYTIQTKSIFIGLILGSIPSLIKQVNKREKFKIKNLFVMILTFALGIIMVLIENNIKIVDLQSVKFIYLVLTGFFMSIGVVVPGVSSTVILMLMGVYTLYLQSVANIYFPVLIPMGIGLIFGGLIFMKVTKMLLDRFYVSSLYGIIGFSIGSTFVLLPEIMNIYDGIIFVISVICGIMIVNAISE